MTGVRKPDVAELDVLRSALEPDYEVVEELGRGGMAMVYRARERQLERDVAVKVLPFSMTFDSEFVERFLREARTAGQLEHPHIVPIYRVGRSGQVIYFVMKLLRGRSLAEVLLERGRLSAPEVRRILIETASALGYAAARGIVHRDVKPDNILLDDEGRCVVTDFGIAKSAADSKLTATGRSVGTPRYMSPEQARAKAVDGRSDIYSLGIVAYECLVGTTPFDGDDAFAILLDHINAPVPRPPLASHEEWELFEIIERMVAKGPEDRFQSVDELIAALGGATAAPLSGATRGHRRAAMLTPTQVGTAPPTYRDEPGVPAPSAALDAGLRFLEAQQARVAAGLGASRSMMKTQMSRLRSLVRYVIAFVAHARVRAAAKGPRFWATAAGGLALFVAAYQGLHFATKHRSQCPRVEAAADAPADPAAARAAAFSLLVDDVDPQSPGSTLDVYYDVCGLDRDAAYTTAITVRRNESALRRLFGSSVDPLTVSFDERAKGPATRRHRTIALDGLPPGSYSLTVRVEDEKGRRQENDADFQVVE